MSRASAPLFIGFASYIDRRATLAGCVSAANYFRYPVGNVRTLSSSNQEGLHRMLYAILCYHDEDTVGSWTKEQDAAVMKKLAVVQDRLTKQGRLEIGRASCRERV